MFKRVVFTALLVLGAGQLVLAHDTWIGKRNGGLVVLRGHGGTNIEAYDPEKIKETKALDAKGQPVEIGTVKNKDDASLATKGSPVIVGALYDSGYWLKTTDGWKKATKREGKGKFDIVEAILSKQFCKISLATGDTSSKPIGQRLEIIPQTDPLTIKPGDKLPLKVLLDGKPLAGAVIKVGGGHDQSKNDLKTDAKGEISAAIEKPGFQLITTSHKVPLKDDPDADVLALASTLTFEVK